MPTPTPGGLALAPGAPIGEGTFSTVLATPTGFVATGWTPDYASSVFAIGSPDGASWQPFDTSTALGTNLDNIAVGPHGWVVAVQGDAPDGEGVGATMFWSGDGQMWQRLADQANLGHSFPGPMAVGAWGYAMLGQADDGAGTSVPAVWTSRDGRTWQQAPPTADAEPQQVLVVDEGVLALGYGTASFTTDGLTWVEAAPVPESDRASSMAASTSGSSDVLVVLTSDGSPTFVRGHIESSAPAGLIRWTDAGLHLPPRTNVTAFAGGPLGAVVLGFDRSTLAPRSWSSQDGRSWRQANLDAATFGGGAPALLAAGEQAFVALGMDVNALGVPRTRAWTSTDGAHWVRADTDALGAFPADPSGTCPATDPVEASALLDLGSTYQERAGAPWPRCLGDRPLGIRGYVRLCEGCGGASPYASRPGWLIDPLGYAAFWLAGSNEGGPSIAVQVNPRNPVRVPRSGAHVRITGHFDDPASSSCRPIPDISEIAELAPPGMAIATCRQTFVVTSIKVLAA